MKKEKKISALTNKLRCIQELKENIKKHPEKVDLGSIAEVLSGDNDDELTAVVSLNANKGRKTRSDAYGEKRSSPNYKGKQKGIIWDLLGKADRITSISHSEDWKQEFNVDPKEWFRLIKALKAAFDNGEDLSSTIQNLGYSKDVSDKLKDEFLTLNNVFNLLKVTIEKALKRRNDEDKAFLNIVKTVWGADAINISREIDHIHSSRGRKPSTDVLNRRLENVREFMKKPVPVKSSKGGDFYYRDLRTALSMVAFRAYVFLHSETRLERRKLDWTKNRNKALNEIQALVHQYQILPSEIDFSSSPKEVPTSPPLPRALPSPALMKIVK